MAFLSENGKKIILFDLFIPPPPILPIEERRSISAYILPMQAQGRT